MSNSAESLEWDLTLSSHTGKEHLRFLFDTLTEDISLVSHKQHRRMHVSINNDLLPLKHANSNSNLSPGGS